MGWHRIQALAQWQASGLSRRAYASEQGLPLGQLVYWVRLLSKAPTVPGLLPVRVPVSHAGLGKERRASQEWNPLD
jgi:uncharacterized membrane protein